MKQHYIKYIDVIFTKTGFKFQPFRVFFAMGILFMVILFVNCEELIRKTGLVTGEALEIGYQNARVSGSITDLSDLPHPQYGFCYAKQPNPNMDDAILDLGSGAGVGNFTAELTGLEPNTEYYYKAFIKDGDTFILDQAQKFTTLTAPLPSLSLEDPVKVTHNSVILIGNIVSGNGDSIKQSGFCFGLNASPTLSDSIRLNKLSERHFTDTLENLQSSTTYYVRMYGTNKYGTGYSNSINFTTLKFDRPTVTTDSAFLVYDVQANLSGTITSEGEGPISEQGFCISSNPNPTINDRTVLVTNGIGHFTTTITGLLPVSQYFIKAFAINEGGVEYGQQLSINTVSPLLLPSIGLNDPQTINFALQRFVGQVYSDGGGIFEMGLCWSESNIYPTLNDNHKKADTVINHIFYVNGVPQDNIQFTMDMYFMKPNTYMNYRVYAKNSAGVAYCNTRTFVTLPGTPPEMTTDGVSRLLATSANIIGSEKPYMSKVPGVSYGICWSTSPNPTKNDNQITASQFSIKSFECHLPDLLAGTTYYAKAWITTPTETGYGNEISFTTLQTSEVITDFDGNEYTSVTIGNQSWLQQNLKSTHYSNGATIDQTKAYANNPDYAEVYGLLYSSAAATNKIYITKTQGACPTGWHLPSDTEWWELINYLGGNGNAATQLKEIGETHWTYQNSGTNSSGFTAIGSGTMRNENPLLKLNVGSYYWSSTPSGTSNSGFGIYSNFSSLDYGSIDNSGTNYLSVRCIKN